MSDESNNSHDYDIENLPVTTAFHPELNDDTTVHRYFLNMLK